MKKKALIILILTIIIVVAILIGFQVYPFNQDFFDLDNRYDSTNLN